MCLFLPGPSFNRISQLVHVSHIYQEENYKKEWLRNVCGADYSAIIMKGGHDMPNLLTFIVMWIKERFSWRSHVICLKVFLSRVMYHVLYFLACLSPPILSTKAPLDSFIIFVSSQMMYFSTEKMPKTMMIIYCWKLISLVIHFGKSNFNF